MKKATNKDISNLTDKSVSTIAGWSSKQPKLIEVVKLGATCKLNEIALSDLQKLIEIKKMMDLVSSLPIKTV